MQYFLYLTVNVCDLQQTVEKSQSFIQILNEIKL